MSDSLPRPQKFGKTKENVVEPKARQPPKKERTKSRRGRFFSLVTYAKAEDIGIALPPNSYLLVKTFNKLLTNRYYLKEYFYGKN